MFPRNTKTYLQQRFAANIQLYDEEKTNVLMFENAQTINIVIKQIDEIVQSQILDKVATVLGNEKLALADNSGLVSTLATNKYLQAVHYLTSQRFPHRDNKIICGQIQTFLSFIFNSIRSEEGMYDLIHKSLAILEKHPNEAVVEAIKRFFYQEDGAVTQFSMLANNNIETWFSTSLQAAGLGNRQKRETPTSTVYDAYGNPVPAFALDLTMMKTSQLAVTSRSTENFNQVLQEIVYAKDTMTEHLSRSYCIIEKLKGEKNWMQHASMQVFALHKDSIYRLFRFIMNFQVLTYSLRHHRLFQTLDTNDPGYSDLDLHFNQKTSVAKFLLEFKSKIIQQDHDHLRPVVFEIIQQIVDKTTQTDVLLESQPVLYLEKLGVVKKQSASPKADSATLRQERDVLGKRGNSKLKLSRIDEEETKEHVKAHTPKSNFPQKEVAFFQTPQIHVPLAQPVESSQLLSRITSSQRFAEPTGKLVGIAPPISEPSLFVQQPSGQSIVQQPPQTIDNMFPVTTNIIAVTSELSEEPSLICRELPFQIKVSSAEKLIENVVKFRQNATREDDEMHQQLPLESSRRPTMKKRPNAKHRTVSQKLSTNKKTFRFKPTAEQRTASHVTKRKFVSINSLVLNEADDRILNELELTISEDQKRIWNKLDTYGQIMQIFQKRKQQIIEKDAQESREQEIKQMTQDVPQNIMQVKIVSAEVSPDLAPAEEALIVNDLAEDPSVKQSVSSEFSVPTDVLLEGLRQEDASDYSIPTKELFELVKEIPYSEFYVSRHSSFSIYSQQRRIKNKMRERVQKMKLLAKQRHNQNEALALDANSLPVIDITEEYLSQKQQIAEEQPINSDHDDQTSNFIGAELSQFLSQQSSLSPEQFKRELIQTQPVEESKEIQSVPEQPSNNLLPVVDYGLELHEEDFRPNKRMRIADDPFGVKPLPDMTINQPGSQFHYLFDQKRKLTTIESVLHKIYGAVDLHQHKYNQQGLPESLLMLKKLHPIDYDSLGAKKILIDGIKVDRMLWLSIKNQQGLMPKSIEERYESTHTKNALSLIRASYPKLNTTQVHALLCATPCQRKAFAAVYNGIAEFYGECIKSQNKKEESFVFSPEECELLTTSTSDVFEQTIIDIIGPESAGCFEISKSIYLAKKREVFDPSYSSKSAFTERLQDAFVTQRSEVRNSVELMSGATKYYSASSQYYLRLLALRVAPVKPEQMFVDLSVTYEPTYGIGAYCARFMQWYINVNMPSVQSAFASQILLASNCQGVADWAANPAIESKDLLGVLLRWSVSQYRKLAFNTALGHNQEPKSHLLNLEITLICQMLVSPQNDYTVTQQIVKSIAHQHGLMVMTLQADALTNWEELYTMSVSLLANIVWKQQNAAAFKDLRTMNIGLVNLQELMLLVSRDLLHYEGLLVTEGRPYATSGMMSHAKNLFNRAQEQLKNFRDQFRSSYPVNERN